MFSAKLALYGTAMLVKPFVPPIWLPENSSNIWSLLWLSGWLIIQIEPTNFYQSSFPNTLTPKKAKNVIQKRIFFDNAISERFVTHRLYSEMRLFPNEEPYWAEKL